MLIITMFLFTVFISTNSVTPPNQLEVQKKIISELSWPLKLHFWKNIANRKKTPPESSEPERRNSIGSKLVGPSRAVGIEAFQLQDTRRQGITELAINSDESSMKMKLFRLMYETVRDSDLKVKRADLIKGHYEKSPAFEIGYLLGDLTEKYNVMTDISLTMKRLYHEWKPIEHMNAYEQITNEAIEISHIFEMIRAATKSANSTTVKPSNKFI